MLFEENEKSLISSAKGRFMNLNRIGREAEKFYNEHKDELEKKYRENIIAIDIKGKKVVAAGKDLKQIMIEARKRKIGHEIAYMCVGEDRAVVKMRRGPETF